MKKYILISGIALITLAIFGFTKLPDATPKEAPAATGTSQALQPTRKFTDIEQELAKGTSYLLDVRTPEEYNTSRFTNATLYPLQTIEAGTLPAISRDSTIYLYCRSGNRSAQASTLLKQAGFTNVIDLGGLTDVEQIGGTLVKN